MNRAGITHRNGLSRDLVSRTTIGGTSVDGMLVVEAAADRIDLNNLEAHDDIGLCAWRYMAGIMYAAM